MTNFKKVFKILKKHYKKGKVPLEAFGKNPYKTLVSTILSSRTNDDTTLKASKRLFKKAPTMKILSKLDIKVLRKLIYPVGF